MQIHLYMPCFRGEALVASHLEPEAFGHYMATGTRKLTRGVLLMFFEIDREKLKPGAFHLHDIEQRCVPHADGAPKRSKYVSIYRVLENIELAAIRRLHLVTIDGRVLSLDASTPDDGPACTEFLYQELAPIDPLIASTLAPSAFTRYMTDPDLPQHLPRLFFADLLLDREGDRLAGHLPYEDPAHIVSCLDEMAAQKSKPTKTVTRTPNIHAFYRTVGRGFYAGDSTGALFFRFPTRRVLETEHAHWWRSAQTS